MAWQSGLATAGIMDHDSLSGAKEFIEAQKAQINEELYFEINWRNDLTVNKTWVKYKDKVFKVVRIDDYEGYKTSLRIYVIEDDKKL